MKEEERVIARVNKKSCDDFILNNFKKPKIEEEEVSEVD
jgi:hypothetical protein